MGTIRKRGIRYESPLIVKRNLKHISFPCAGQAVYYVDNGRERGAANECNRLISRKKKYSTSFVMVIGEVLSNADDHDTSPVNASTLLSLNDSLSFIRSSEGSKENHHRGADAHQRSREPLVSTPPLRTREHAYPSVFWGANNELGAG